MHLDQDAMLMHVGSLPTFGPVSNRVRRKQKQHFQEDELLVGLFGRRQSFHIKQSRLSKETYSGVIKAQTTTLEDDARGSTAAAEVSSDSKPAVDAWLPR